MTKKVLAIIPARGGSKGIKDKNIVNLAGKPLLAWTIEASLHSKYISKTLVSSDSKEILKIASLYGASILQRPKDIALDTSPSESTILHALEAFKNENFEYIVLLQPTSPLRGSLEIDKAFKSLFETKASSLISVSMIDNKILKAFKKDANGFITPISDKAYPFMRRQDLPKTYMSNGAIYIIRTDDFLQYNTLLTNKAVSFIMDHSTSIDIDTIDDLHRAETYLLKKEPKNA